MCAACRSLARLHLKPESLTLVLSQGGSLILILSQGPSFSLTVPGPRQAYDDLIHCAVVACYLRNALLLEPLAACELAPLREIAKGFQLGAPTSDPNFLQLAPSGGRFALLATTMVFPLPPSLAKLEGNAGSSAGQLEPSPRHTPQGDPDTPGHSDGGSMGSLLRSVAGGASSWF